MGPWFQPSSVWHFLLYHTAFSDLANTFPLGEKKAKRAVESSTCPYNTQLHSLGSKRRLRITILQHLGINRPRQQSSKKRDTKYYVPSSENTQITSKAVLATTTTKLHPNLVNLPGLGTNLRKYRKQSNTLTSPWEWKQKPGPWENL